MKGKRVRKSHLFLLAIVICMANLILFKSTAFADPDPNCNHSWSNGVCTICGYECQHQTPENTIRMQYDSTNPLVPSTCSTHGNVHYSLQCSICNSAYDYKEVELPLDPYAHSLNQNYIFPPSKENCGCCLAEYSCPECEFYYVSGLPPYDHTFEWNFEEQAAICKYCGYHMPQGDGSSSNPYQLSTYQDLYWFSNMVNSINPAACAVLTDDIVINTELLDDYGVLSVNPFYAFTEWIPIGSKAANAYDGTFNGQGHTISGLYCYSDQYDGVGLFGVIEENAKIYNVSVLDSFFYGYAHPTGSIVGAWGGDSSISDNTSRTENYIRNCTSNSTVISQSYAGGIIGTLSSIGNRDGSGSSLQNKHMNYVTDCIFSGKAINYFGDHAAGIVAGSGYLDSISRCVNIGDVSYFPTSASSINYYSSYGTFFCNGTRSTGQFTNISSCYYLSGGAQGRGCKQLSQEQVNNGSMCHITKRHTYVDDHCIYCGAEKLVPLGSGTENDPYQITSYDDFLWISNNVHTACHLKLMNDIILNDDLYDESLVYWEKISLPSDTVLDGNGHKIQGAYAEQEDGSYENSGLFSYLTQCTVKNLYLEDNLLKVYPQTSFGFEYETILPICTYSENTQFINCGAYGEDMIWSPNGVLNKIQGAFSCIGSYQNCFSCENGGYINPNTGEHVVVYGSFGSNYSNIPTENCYRLGEIEVAASNGIATKTWQSFGSGEVCYLLNGDQSNIVFKQDLTAPYSLPGYSGPQVYYGYSSCTATEPDYGNDPRYPEAGHDFVDGICTKCGSYNIEGDGTKANPYQLTNADQLYWFAAQVNEEGRNDICAILMDDIVVNNNVLDPTYKLNGTPARSWTPIGNNSEPTYDQVHYPSSYAGIFDGNGHFISGLYCKDPYLTYVGLFGLITESVIKNLTVKDSYFEGYDSVGGIVGAINDDGYSECAGVIRECHFNGVVKGNYEIGGICGNMNGPSSYRNNEGKEYTDTYLMYCLAEGKVICTRDDGNWVGGVLGGWFGGQLIDNHYEWHMAEDGSGTTQYGTGASSYGYTSEDEQGKTWPVSVNWAYANLICSPGNTLHEDFEDKNRVCHHCNLAMPSTMYSVAAYSRSDVSEASVANISINGNSQFYAGETVTLTAPDMNQEGYRFLGWYAVTTVNAGNVTAYGNKLSSNLAYSFTIAADTQCVAVYQPQGNVEVTISVVNGAKYYLSTDPNTIRSGSTVNVPLGSKLTISAEDDEKVLQWQNEAKKLLGSGADLTITVTSNMTITLVYKTVDDGQSFIQFVSDYGQVLSYDQYSSSSPIALPELPTKIGYTPICWVFEDGTTADNDSIRAKIGTDDIITLKPKYEATSETRTITVQYINTSDGDATVRAEEILTKDLGSAFTLTAPSIDSLDFSCWKDVSGTVLSYQKNYYLLVSADATVIACYVSQGTQQEEVLPVISLSDLYKVTSGETKKVSAIATRNIPEGYTLVEHGMLYARDFNAPTADNFTYEAGSTSGTGVSKYVATNSELNGTLTLNVKVDTEAVKVTFRGYMVLKNTATGNNEVFYTNIKSASYAEIQ